MAHQRVGERAAQDAPDMGSDDATAGGEGGTGADGVQHEIRVVEVAHLRHTPCKEREARFGGGGSHVRCFPPKGSGDRSAAHTYRAGARASASSAAAAPRGRSGRAGGLPRRSTWFCPSRTSHRSPWRTPIDIPARHTQLIGRPANKWGNRPNCKTARPYALWLEADGARVGAVNQLPADVHRDVESIEDHMPGDVMRRGLQHLLTHLAASWAWLSGLTSSLLWHARTWR